MVLKLSKNLFGSVLCTILLSTSSFGMHGQQAQPVPVGPAKPLFSTQDALSATNDFNGKNDFKSLDTNGTIDIFFKSSMSRLKKRSELGFSIESDILNFCNSLKRIVPQASSDLSFYSPNVSASGVFTILSSDGISLFVNSDSAGKEWLSLEVGGGSYSLDEFLKKASGVEVKDFIDFFGDAVRANIVGDDVLDRFVAKSDDNGKPKIYNAIMKVCKSSLVGEKDFNLNASLLDSTVSEKISFSGFLEVYGLYNFWRFVNNNNNKDAFDSNKGIKKDDLINGLYGFIGDSDEAKLFVEKFVGLYTSTVVGGNVYLDSSKIVPGGAGNLSLNNANDLLNLLNSISTDYYFPAADIQSFSQNSFSAESYFNSLQHVLELEGKWDRALTVSQAASNVIAGVSPDQNVVNVPNLHPNYDPKFDLYLVAANDCRGELYDIVGQARVLGALNPVPVNSAPVNPALARQAAIMATYRVGPVPGPLNSVLKFNPNNNVGFSDLNYKLGDVISWFDKLDASKKAKFANFFMMAAGK